MARGHSGEVVGLLSARIKQLKVGAQGAAWSRVPACSGSKGLGRGDPHDETMGDWTRWDEAASMPMQ